ncbi:MAG TPA: VOC family protein [Bryobacteraceae bacterium]|nr:VOC family protein [Bryobacteraceae bacterium]
MIQRLSHTTLMVDDQNIAKDFYVNKLGFDLRTDHDMGQWRWVTVSPKGQPDLQIVLMPIDAYPKLDDAGRADLRRLMKSGSMPTGVMQTADCRKTYAELKAKGVEFRGEPKEQFYGVEAVFSDPSGNWFSLTEPKGQ